MLRGSEGTEGTPLTCMCMGPTFDSSIKKHQKSNVDLTRLQYSKKTQFAKRGWLVIGSLIMDASISLRQAEIDNIEQIKEILFCILKEYEIAIPDNYSVCDIDSINFKNNSSQFYVLLRNDSVIGFMVLRPITNDCIELKRLYLSSSERGIGLGAYLLNYAIDFAQKNQYKSMRLETTSRFKEAISLYKKFDFMVLNGVEKAPEHDLVFEKTF
jgi:ribosomal protein S18 acetylase RimI-like enzyme